MAHGHCTQNLARAARWLATVFGIGCTVTTAIFAHRVAHAAQMERLQAEGHAVVQRGKRFFVVGYESKLG